MNIVTNQPNRNDLLAKIRPVTSNPIQISSGLKIPLNDNSSSYQPLVTINNNNHHHSDEDNFISLTKNELKIFHQNDNDDDDDLEFRTHQPIKHSICCYQCSCSLKDSLCSIS